jgi:hypothetical protein
MKVFSKLLMLTLVSSVLFAGCSKDEDLPLEGVAGTYEGTLTVLGGAIPNVSITITYSDNKAKLSIPAGSIPIFEAAIEAECTVTSDEDKYSISGTVSVSMPVEGSTPILIPVTIENSTISKSGSAIINIKVNLPAEVPPGGTLTAKFEGQKK